MIKATIGLSLIASLLMLSGCGDNAAESRLKAQQALDKGNYTNAIATLEAKQNKSSEDKMLLASSYMGEAGFSLTDTVSIVSKSTDVTTDFYANFSKNVADAKDPQTLQNIQKAIAYYNSIGTTQSRANIADITIGDRDLYLGLAYLIKATVAVGYLGDVADLQSSQTIGSDMLASSCAIVNIYAPTSALPTGCTEVTRVPIDGYTRVDVLLDNGNGKVFSRLANAGATELLLTDYRAKTLTPIQVDGKDVSIKDVLVDTINDAFTLIERIAPDDVKSDIDKFKTDIGVDANGKISSQTISDYIAKNK